MHRIIISLITTLVLALGGCGDHRPDNQKEFADWLKKAEAGDATAQFAVGIAYANGKGAPKDDAKAVEWYRKAAEQGYADAQYNLGVMYANGDGVPRDLVRAYVWFNLAAAQGDEDAQKSRDRAEAQLTPAQRAEGQRLASGWKPGDIL